MGTPFEIVVNNNTEIFLGVGLRNDVISNIKGGLNWRFLSGYTYSFALVEIELHSPFSRPAEHFINILLKVSYVRLRVDDTDQLSIVGKEKSQSRAR